MFIKYQHLERRFDIGETQGILDSEYVILQPKLDGSNCSMWCENGQIHIASRNNELSYQKDNAGCYNTLINDENIKDYFRRNPDVRLYGEWVVPHKIKYREDAYRKFYVFDIVLPDGEFLSGYSYLIGLILVPYLVVDSKELAEAITNGTVFEKYKELGNFLIDSDTPAGEGLVIKNYNWKNKHGRQTWVKLINDEVFRNGQKIRKPQIPIDAARECEFLNTVSDHVFHKEYHKIEDFENKDIGTYIRNCQTEVFDDYVKDHIEKEGIADWKHKPFNNLVAKRALEFLKQIQK